MTDTQSNWPPPVHFQGADVPIPEPYRFEVAVHALSREEAEQVMAERLDPDEDYGFEYGINYRDAQVVVITELAHAIAEAVEQASPEQCCVLGEEERSVILRVLNEHNVDQMRA